MNLEIEIINEQEEYNVLKEQVQLLERVIKAAASEEHINNSELAITLVDEEMIRELNLYYRGIDQSTDVLSFALDEKVEGEIELNYEEYLLDESDLLVDTAEPLNLLGDIIISMPHVYRQAAEYEHSIERELAFLALHGFLHLIGEDHQSDETAKQMNDKQERILTSLKILR